MTLTDVARQSQNKKIDRYAMAFVDYESSIENLYRRNKDACLYSMAEKNAKFETRKIRFGFWGNCIVVFIVQSILSALVLLINRFFAFQGQGMLSAGLETSFLGLLFIGVFFIVFLFIIYRLELKKYQKDRMKFEIQTRKLADLVANAE